MPQLTRDVVTLRLPEEITPFFNEIKMPEKVATQAFVLDLVKRHRISASKGAELSDMALQDFIELMGENRVPLFEYQKGEMEEELESLRRVSKS